MKPALFAYRRPGSLPEAVAALAGEPGAKVLAGGQSLVPLLSMRLAAPSMLVDLGGLAELRGIIPTAEGGLRIGAMTRHVEVERSPLVKRNAPLLAEAMPHVAHPQIRSRGTIGGSLAHADPSAELPAVMLALNAPVGVPDNTPAELSDIPDGTPPVGVHVTAPAFPSAVSVYEYALPTNASGS